MKTNYILSFLALMLLVSFQTTAQVDVTLKVDMSGQTISPDGIHVVGTINDWNTTSTMLTQEGSTSVYSVTIPLNSGWHEYKFLNGNAWGAEEQAGYPCAPSNGNRFLYVNDSGVPVVLAAVPFGGCNASGTSFEVTLNVDISDESSVSGNGIHIAGPFNGWNPGNLALPNVNGDIHSGTFRLPTPLNYPIVFEYKYLNGNTWGTEETPGPEETCETVTGTNRLVTVNNSGESLLDVFNGCNYTLGVNSSKLSDAISIFYKKNEGLILNIKESNFQNLKVHIYDLSGRNITFKEISGSAIIPLNQMSKGVYFARINDTNNNSMVKKFIVF
ncbi:T9SS type A sorting domain-containing protein [Cognatitamlana onchidii]|uniref:T9SS type A sorting domain-containing protein n=1 Tax=Cognatitamlana onchidii TaxID=2562860 RepID=UPI0010A66621|nr:T9SS type A sorting domain-containing protein [Algibacter onchidii]